MARTQAEGSRQALARTFLERSTRMLERLSAAAPANVLQQALAAPSDVGGVATLLSNLAPLDLDLSPIDPLVEALARGVKAKRDLLRRAGGGLTATQAAAALGISRQAVDKRRLRGTLLAVPNGSGDYLYPACQFDTGGVVPNLEEALKAFQIRDPWTQLSVLISKAPSLSMRTPIAALRAGDLDRVRATLDSFGEQGG